MKTQITPHRKKWSWTSCMDSLLLLVALIGMILLFLNVSYKNFWVGLIGLIGASLWIHYFYVWLAHPTKRDWILVNSHIMRRIASGVLLAPFALVFIYIFSEPQILEHKNCNTQIPIKQGMSKSGKSVGPTATGQTFGPTPTAVANAPATTQCDTTATDFFMEVYYSFMDPGAQKESGAVIGREWAAIISLLGVFLLNGLLVSTIVGWFDRRREQWLKGSIRYKHLNCKSLYVIIGGNEMSLGIVNHIFDKDPDAYVLIETAKDVEEYRRVLFSSLKPRCCERTIIYYGNRTSVEDIRNLHLDKAKELYILGEDVETDDHESQHDSLNMRCLELVATVCKEQRISKEGKPTLLKCMVMFEYQSTFSIFQYSEISDSIKDYLTFIPFNRYELWAQQVLICKEMKDINNCKYLPLEGFEGIHSNDDTFVHLVIVGMSRMGTALAIEAAHLAHYPNFLTQKKRTRITFIDTNMEQEYDFFRGKFDALFKYSRVRYVDVSQATAPLYDNPTFPWHTPLLDSHENAHLGGDFLDIEWEFIAGSVEKPFIQDYLSQAASHPHAKFTLAVCLPETNKSVATAIYLPQPVYKHALQVLIYQSANDALISNFNNDERLTPFKGKLRGFGMLSETYDTSFVEECCLVAQEVGESYNTAKRSEEKYREMATNLIKEFSPAPSQANPKAEENDPEFLAMVERLQEEIAKDESGKKIGKTQVCKWWSNIYNGNMLWTKLRCVGASEQPLTKEQLWLISNVEHNRWNMEQLLLHSSPATQAEQYVMLHDKGGDCKNYFNNKMIHCDICSGERLRTFEGNTYYIDVGMTDCLPEIKKKVLTLNTNKQ